jgi:peroxiredoxin
MIMRPVARTSRSLNAITFLVLLGAIMVIIVVFKNNLNPLFDIVALISVVIWLLYVYWYSILPQRKSNIRIGSEMPDLHLIDGEEEEISTGQFIGKKVLYMFYRGNWCPLCMAQIKEISAQYKELESRGVEVLLISPQPTSHSKSLAKKMGVNFRFLTDKDNAMARMLKIDHAYGTPLGMEIFGYMSETVLPTVIITDEKRKIIFVDQTDNYRIRPEPETFLNIIDV